MRSLTCFVLVAALAAAAAVQARSFRQTYGATVPTGDGGCAWNLNQDYFVPRHCDSCRYDLFSACKTAHTNSPACRHLHPVYHGYCTPFGPCRYKWRDHVYKVHCGCTPLRCVYGPWHLEKCKKHCLVMKREALCGPLCGEALTCSGSTYPCQSCGTDAADFGSYTYSADAGWLPNVEPLDGEILGTLAAMPLGAMAGGSRGPVASPVAGSSSATTSLPPSLLPAPMNLPPPASGAGGSAFSLPPAGF